MLKKEYVVSESGKVLLDANDGFVIYGALFKADGEGGLIGGMESEPAINGVPGKAYTNFEFLDLLNIDLEVLKQYVEYKTPRPRSFNIGVTKS